MRRFDSLESDRLRPVVGNLTPVCPSVGDTTLAFGDDTLALVVKAADRLANLRESSKPGSEKQLAKYRGEHPEFRKAVYRPGLCEPVWAEIDAAVGGAR